MYISPWLQSIILPKEWDVCGVACDPMSIWHVYILRSALNPYICGGVSDFDSAVEVLMYCMGDVNHGNRLYNDPVYRKKCRKKVTKSVKRKIKKHGKDRLNDAVIEYTMECLRKPTHSIPVSKEKKGKPITAPEEFVLAEYLMQSGVCKGFENAMNYQYSKAICIFDAGRNYRGEDEGAPVVSEDREQELDRVEEEKAAA